MNKEEFLKSLRKKLSILEESEIEDIISEYEGYIDEKIAGGSTEKEAVKSMGSVDELARDLLSAYKIKNPEEKTKDTFNHLADGFLNVFERIIDVFSNKSFSEILRFIIELVFIFLIITICKIPFEIIESMGRSIFSSLGGSAYHILNGIWNFVLEFSYLIFAILLFIKIFESRYLNDFKVENKKEFLEEKPRLEKKQNQENKSDKIIEKKEHQSLGIIDGMTNLCILFIKVIAFCILLGVIFYIIGMATTLGLSIYLIIKGVFYFGIYSILLALFILGIVAFFLLFNFIFNRKSKVGILLITSLVSFVILGIGVSISVVEFASTNIIYNDVLEEAKTEDFTFDMQENLVLGMYIDEDNMIVDDSMNNQIKIEYIYNEKYVHLTPNPYINTNSKYSVLHATYHVNELHFTKNAFDKIIEDLKNKTIRVYDQAVQVKVYVSNSVKEELRENAQKYQKHYAYENEDIEDLCEELYERGYQVPSYCTNYVYYQEM